MDGGSLGKALGALENDLRQALAGSVTADAVEVEVGLTVEMEDGNVHWALAPPGHAANHHLRFTVKRGLAGRGGGPDQKGHSVPMSDTTVIRDVDLGLPPIVRPKPGVRDDDDD